MLKQKGQTLVEFALVLPILLLVIFVIVESGRIFQAYVTVQHAAREGARYAVTGRWEDEFAGDPDPRVASIRAVAQNALAGLVIEGPAGYDADARVLPRHYEIKIFGQNPNPPPTLLEGYAGLPGEKVVVQVAYRLEIITPVLNVIAPSVQVVGYAEMINEDFGQLGGGGFAGVREPPSPIPPEIPTAGASPTPTNTPTGTVTPTPTETGTPTETPTITATPMCGVEIQEPVYAADTTVTVSGDPGDTITLLDMDAGGATVGSGVVTGNGYCGGSAVISVNGNLVNGHIIAAVSSIHPSADTACVGVTACWPTPTPTATPTRTPTPTATPTGPYIVLSHSCIPESQETDITVYGYNWPTGNKTIYILWDDDSLDSFLSRATWFSTYRISASQATSGTHTMRALIPAPPTEDSENVVVPCPPTPTPTTTATPLRPDLVITSLAVSPGTVITAYMPVTFTVSVRNQGLGDALSLFWVDLYDLPEGSGPPTAGQSEGDATWKAVGSLGSGDTTSVLLYYYFTEPYTRVVYSYVDTRENINEGPYEYNNASQPLTLTITAGAPPSATLNVDPVCIYTTSVPMTITLSGQGWPTTGTHDIQYDNIPRGSANGASWNTNISLNITDTAPGLHTIYVQNGSTVKTISYQSCSAMGAIDGYTRLFLPGVGIVFQERVNVYCRDAGGNLVAQTTSGDYGYYVLEHIAPGGPYSVIGQTTIDNVLYIDTATGITVTTGITERVNLLLMPQY